jgi:CubicO group peptidase (beta-lactamase class C family)
MQPGWTHQDMLHYHREIDGLNWQFGGEKMRFHFLNRSQFLPHAVIPRGGEVRALPLDLRKELGQFIIESRMGQMALDDYIRLAPVNGLVIVHRGRLVYERYPRMRPLDKHLLMSVSKPFVSALVALLAEHGQVDARQPVERYLPALEGSAWAETPVQDVLDMASGIDAPEEEEGFTNPTHPYYRYEASLGWLPAVEGVPASTYEYVAGLRRKGPSGQQFEYTSVNTFLLAWLVESVTGQPLHEVIAAEIWQKMGAEADGLLAISRAGAPAAHGGLCATLRDVARFGLLFTSSGQAHNAPNPLPQAWMQKIQTGGRTQLFHHGPSGRSIAQALHGEAPSHNIDQWDFVMPDGDFYKNGYGGQGLYVSPRLDLVVAFFGTPFDGSMQAHELPWITRQMVNGGIFNVMM